MSWGYPREKFSTSYIMDCDDFNANIAAWSHETDGNLNEHNFAAGTALASSMDKATDGIAVKLLHSKNEVDPTASGGTLGYEVPHSINWTPIEDCDIEFSSVGESLLVVYSFQLNNPGGTNQSGLLFCIELDGAPMMNSLIGTGDESNDYTNPADVPDQEYNFDTGPAMRASSVPLMVKGTYKLPPGRHRTRLLARNLHLIDDTPLQYISQREVLVMKAWC